MRRRSNLLSGFSLCRARKTFNPFLVIAVERTGILVPELLEEVGALLRLLGKHMTPSVCGSDDPAVIGARTGLTVSYTHLDVYKRQEYDHTYLAWQGEG